jgi:NitT/TauT family transport system substrate-binding protein
MDERTETRSRGVSRRSFLAGISALSSTALLALPEAATAEPPPETTTIRLLHLPAICMTPQYLAEELLYAEGFTHVEYVESQAASAAQPQLGDDMSMQAAPSLVAALDGGGSLVALAGIHAGCYELFGNDRVQSVRDLKGKRVAISVFGSSEHVFIASIAAYVGLHPGTDIDWVVTGANEAAMRRFIEGQADAFLGFAPQPHELRAQQVGRVLLNTTHDRPWSQYFCCVFAAQRHFVARHPVATKRALRAMLKATDICAQEPERAAQYLVTKSYEPRYDVALEVLKELPYRRWREANPEDTLRFHALRLHEVGMIKASPEKLLTQGTDWRFLNALKKEMKT